jgi:hypothetical protein
MLAWVAVTLGLAQGCYYHHDNGGYHRDFAFYTPEHTTAGHHRHWGNY